MKNFTKLLFLNFLIALFPAYMMAQCTPDATGCYDSGETDVVLFEITADNVIISAGSFETNFDDLTVYSGVPGSGTAGTIVFGPADGDLIGTIIATAAPGETLIFVSNSDGSVSCASGSQTTLDVFIGTTLPTFGCTDPTAVNFDPAAVCDDGSCIPPPPANDECANAIPATVNAACPATNTSGNTASSTASTLVGSCDFGGDFDVFYSFTAPASGVIELSEISSAAGLEAAVWDDCAGTMELGCGTLDGLAVSGLTPGSTYILGVWNDSFEASGAFEICILAGDPPPAPPANDDCTGAIPLVCGAPAISGTTVSATAPAPNTCASALGVWYTFLGDGSVVTVTSVAGAGYDHEVDVFSSDSDCAGTLTQIICRDGAGTAGTETTTFPTMPGVNYYFYVAHWSATSAVTGDFDIAITCATCGDPTAVAVANITGTSVDVSWTAGGVSATSATVWVCPDGVVAPDAACIETTTATNPQTVAGLTACTSYDVFVQEFCGVEPTEIVGPVSFDAGGAANLTPGCGEVLSYPSCLNGYAASENITFTVCPDPGGYVGITFTYVDIESNATCSWDALNISTPSSAVGPLCGEPDGDGGVGSGLAPGDCFFAVNPDECITVVFTSDGSAQETGFEFIVNCDAVAPVTPCAVALPVELASFTGKAMSKSNMLEWVTASEENTQWHVIERSKDGRSEWTEVGRTEAKGFSSQLINYQLEDNQPMAKSYYRLRSVDFDGHVDISDVIYLERKINGFDVIKVYPVPTSKLLNIDFETAQDQQVEIRMTDMLGKVITIRPVNAVAGINTATLEMSNLANGVYFVTINNGQDKITKRVVKN